MPVLKTLIGCRSQPEYRPDLEQAGLWRHPDVAQRFVLDDE